jgi:predicted O-methyltransferase YrrM
MFPRSARRFFKGLAGPLAGKAIHYLEIGVWHGASLHWMAQRVLTHAEARGIGVDSWQDRPPEFRGMAEVEKACRRKLEPFQNILLFKANSTDWLRTAYFSMKDRFDLVYIDGDHSASACIQDAVLSWPLVKPGAMLAFDDYETVCQEPVDAFLRCHDTEVLATGRQLWCRKSS